MEQIEMNVFEQVSVALNGQRYAEKTYHELVRVISNLFDPPGMLASCRHKLFSAKQKAGQTSTSYIQEVKALTMKADLTRITNVRDFVQVQTIVAGLSDDLTRARLLEEPNLNLERLEELVRVTETARKEAKNMNASPQVQVAYADRKKKKPVFQPQGQKRNFRNERNRSDQPNKGNTRKDVKGHKCGKKGHYKNECWSKRTVRTVDEQYNECSEDSYDGEIFHVEQEKDVVNKVLQYLPPAMLDVKIEKEMTEMELDSGTVMSIIPENL